MLKIREATFDDFRGIKVLGSRYGLETKSYAEWRHLWDGNPAVTYLKNSWPMGWVLEDGDGQIAGYLGNVPLAYELEGARLIAAASTYFVVDLKYRNHSILLAQEFFRQRHADLFLNTTAIYESAKAFSIFKTRPVPVESCDVSLFWVINHQDFISSAFIKKGFSSSRFIKYPVSLGMRCADSIIRRNDVSTNMDTQCCDLFDERFDLFWNKLRQAYGNRLFRIRDAEWLNWHFKHAIDSKKARVIIIEKNSAMVGYAIFLRQDNPEIGLRRTKLVDLQSLGDRQDVVTAAISYGIKMCRMENIDMLEIAGFNLRKKMMARKHLPYRRKLAAWPFFFKANNSSLAEKLNSPHIWDPCLLDGDASL